MLPGNHMNIRKPISTTNVKFPDPWVLPEDSDGLVYIGGNLKPETLVQAYSMGIFPWPLEEIYPLFWFCPQPRGVLDFANLHIPRSLEKIRAGFEARGLVFSDAGGVFSVGLRVDTRL